MARRFAMLLAAALLLAGCLPVATTSPLGGKTGFKADSDLYGMWQGVSGDEAQPGSKSVAYLAFLPDKDARATAILISMPVPVKGGDWSGFSVSMATLGPYHYLNAREFVTNGEGAKSKKDSRTFPVFYRIGPDGALTLSLIDEDAAKAAVRAGKIGGRIEPGEFGDVVLTAAPGPLDAFFASDAGRALFKKPLVVLRKVN